MEHLRVHVTLKSGRAGVQAVRAEGPRRFIRCAIEQWQLVSIDGVEPGGDWGLQLTSGARTQLVLERPRNRAFVLRKPEAQLCRLLVQLSARSGTHLLVAPTGSPGAVAVLTASPGPLFPPQVLDEIEIRFSVVVTEPNADQVVPLGDVSEVILRRLVVATISAEMHGLGWAAIEQTSRLCRAEVFANSKRAHIIDVACRSAAVDSAGRLVVDLDIVPSVWEMRQWDATSHNERNADPRVHVLPQLTAAEVTRTWPAGLPETSGLPPDLRSPSDFVDYWYLVHGYSLPPASLRSFALVEFKGFSLTYPMSCLWRSPWVPLPMETARDGRDLLQVALASVQRLHFLGSEASANALPFSLELLGDGPLARRPDVVHRNPAPVLPLVEFLVGVPAGPTLAQIAPCNLGVGPTAPPPWRAQPPQALLRTQLPASRMAGATAAAEAAADALRADAVGTVAAAAVAAGDDGVAAPGPAEVDWKWQEAEKDARRRGKRLLLAPVPPSQRPRLS